LVGEGLEALRLILGEVFKGWAPRIWENSKILPIRGGKNFGPFFKGRAKLSWLTFGVISLIGG